VAAPVAQQLEVQLVVVLGVLVPVRQLHRRMEKKSDVRTAHVILVETNTTAERRIIVVSIKNTNN
jgi:hypothetical protein